MAILARADRPCPKEPTHCPFSVLLSTMANRPQFGPDPVALEALAVGTQDELCRPCVDCGLYTYCDGNDWGECFAADRMPQEHWANNQRTPLCTACDRRFNMCHFCRGLLWAVPPAHRDPHRYTAAPGIVPPRSSDQPIFTSLARAPPRHIDLTAEDDPRGYDDEIFWEATQRAGGHVARESRSPLHPEAKPPPTPAHGTERISGSRGGVSRVSSWLRPPQGQSGPGCGLSCSRAGFDRSAWRRSS